jgi:hypothetical protein
MKTPTSIALLLLFYSHGAIADDHSFERISAQSHRDSRTPKGMAWEQRNAADGGTMLTPIVNKCRKTAPEGREDNFSLLVSLGKQGLPLKVLVSPETKFSECVRSGVASSHFPEPPWEGYWLEINMGK